MDIQPWVTRAHARAVPADNNAVPLRHSASLRHSILGPPPEACLDASFAAAAPVTPPHMRAQPFVQPAWVVPCLNGKDTLQAQNAVCNSRSITQASTPANFVSDSPRSTKYHEIRGPAMLDSPMAQDYPESNEEWYGVAVSHLSKPNGAYATSGEEGTVPSHCSHPLGVYSSPGDDDYMCLSPHSGCRGPPSRGSPSSEPYSIMPGFPTRFSFLPPYFPLASHCSKLVADHLPPSASTVRIRDFAEVPLHPPPANPAAGIDLCTGVPPRGPFHDQSLAVVSEHSLHLHPRSGSVRITAICSKVDLIMRNTTTVIVLKLGPGNIHWAWTVVPIFVTPLGLCCLLPTMHQLILMCYHCKPAGMAVATICLPQL